MESMSQPILAQMRSSQDDEKFKRKPKTEKYSEMKDVTGSSSEYYETLDLSQEDIQRTLSANMPLSCSTSDRSF